MTCDLSGKADLASVSACDQEYDIVEKFLSQTNQNLAAWSVNSSEHL